MQHFLLSLSEKNWFIHDFPCSLGDFVSEIIITLLGLPLKSNKNNNKCAHIWKQIIIIVFVVGLSLIAIIAN